MSTTNTEPDNRFQFDPNIHMVVVKAHMWQFFKDQLVKQMTSKMKLKGLAKNEVVTASVPILPGFWTIMFPSYPNGFTLPSIEDIHQHFSDDCEKIFNSSYAKLKAPLVLVHEVDDETAEEYVKAEFIYAVYNSVGVEQ